MRGTAAVYLFRGGALERLTADHTMAGELARQGVIRPEDTGRHRFRHVVTNVLGGGRAGVQTDVRKADLQTGDALLLCTDGLTDMLPDEQLAAVLASEADPKAVCERLVAEANARGGRDNITVLVARFEAV